MTIIALSGKKGSGKSSLAQALLRNASELWPGKVVKKFALADPLKGILVDILGVDPALVYGDDTQKNTLTGLLWENLPHYHLVQIDRARKAISEGGTEGLLKDVCPSGPMTVREVLQEVGTGIFRRFSQQVWVNALLRAIRRSDAQVAVIDDVRFANEAQGVTDAGGVVVRLTRGITGDSHLSETALDGKSSLFSLVLDNQSQSFWETERALINWLCEQGFANPNLPKVAL